MTRNGRKGGRGGLVGVTGAAKSCVYKGGFYIVTRSFALPYTHTFSLRDISQPTNCMSSKRPTVLSGSSSDLTDNVVLSFPSATTIMFLYD